MREKLFVEVHPRAWKIYPRDVLVCDACRSLPTIAYLGMDGKRCLTCHTLLREVNGDELARYRIYLRQSENPRRVKAGMPTIELVETDELL